MVRLKNPALFAALAGVVLGTACTGHRGPRGFEPVQFEAAPSTVPGDPFPNWPIPPDEAEALMKGPQYDVRVMKRTAAGTSGAVKIELDFEEIDRTIAFKGKIVPPDLGGYNNSPRKEIAAYALQKLFLDPEDYVVPTTLVRCPPFEVYTRHMGWTDPQVVGAECILVMAALWLENVTVPQAVYDRDRFVRDPVYARYLADFNLLTYLIEHKDGRDGNILVSKDDARRQVFAIDNGISFQPGPVQNYFVPNWHVLRVAALRKQSVERLRALSRQELDSLLVAQQLEDDGKGNYRDAEPGPPLEPDKGLAERDGVVQFGLTRGEVDDVWKRIQKLLGRVDDGEIPLF